MRDGAGTIAQQVSNRLLDGGLERTEIGPPPGFDRQPSAVTAAWVRTRALVWTTGRVADWQATGLRPAVAVWTAAQLAAFLDFVRDDRLYALWWLLALRGLRRGELAGLRWADLDLDHRQLVIVRARRLLLSTVGKTVHSGGTAALWQATMDALLSPGDADAAAGEVSLMLVLTGTDLDYRDLNAAVADALAGEGWHGQASGQPITGDQTAGLLGNLRRRLRLFGLTTQERLGQPSRLTPAGYAAAHTALRA